MDDETVFDLPVHYREKELLLPAVLQPRGYTYRFEVAVGDTVIFFEPDEEGSFRALTEEGSLPAGVDAELLQAIAGAIAALLK